MAIPEWHSLSHHNRYRKLNIVRRRLCRRLVRESEDVCGRTVTLNGAWINDIPSFYLSLGEAINGPNGYFGACLDSLSDCLCGSFGVRLPFTIRLSHFEEVRRALEDIGGFGSYFDALVEVLERGGSTIVAEDVCER